MNTTTPIQNFLIKHELLDVDDFAKLMGWSEETVKQKLARRETPDFIRIKRIVLFPYDAVMSWLLREGEKVSTNAANAAAAADLLGAGK